MSREVLFTAVTILVAIFLAIGAMDLVDVMMDAEFTKQVSENKRDVRPELLFPLSCDFTSTMSGPEKVDKTRCYSRSQK